MVWAPTATIDLGNFDNNMRSFIDNYLSLMPNWTVATPTTSTSDRNMRYDMGAGNNYGENGSGQYQYYMFDSSVDKVNGHYNSNASATWEDQVYTGSGGMSLYPTAQPIRVWTNSSLLDSFILLDTNGEMVWGWFECQKWIIYGQNATYPGTTNGLSNTLPLGFSRNNGRIAGYPGQDTYNQSNARWMAFDLDCQDSGRNFVTDSSNMKGKIIQGFRMMQTDSTTSSAKKATVVGFINTDQVLLQMGSISGSMFTGVPITKVTDGTNWWLRTNDAIDESSLMFPVGTSEPSFS